MAQRFTAEQDALIQSMLHQGASDAAIAAQIGRPVYAVRNRRRRIGILRTPDNTDQRRKDHLAEIILPKLEAGDPLKDIAEAAGMSPSSLSHWMRVRSLNGGVGNVRLETREFLPEGADARIVPHVPGYSVTADGKVWSEQTDPPYALIPRKGKAAPRVRLSIGSKSHYCYVALLVAEAFHGPRPAGCIIGYRDGDSANAAADNVYWRVANSRVEPAEFVRAWQSSESATEAAEKLGITLTYAYMTARKMRGHGVPLKAFRSAKPDWESLTELAKELMDEK